MDGWTALIAAQQGLREDTLDQYFKLEGMNQCAMMFGLQPVNSVTLTSDVLGQLVFSALGRSVAGGKRSRDAQLRFNKQMIDIVDRGVDKYATYAPILSDPKLSKGEKAEWLGQRVLDEFGGPSGAVLSAVTLLSAGNLSSKVFGDLLTNLHAMLKQSDDFKPTGTVKNSKEVEQKVTDLLQAYTEMKQDKAKAIQYLKTKMMGCPHAVWDLITTEKAGDDKLGVIAYFNVLDDDHKKKEMLKNPLSRAVFIWQETTAHAFDQFINKDCKPPKEPPKELKSISHDLQQQEQRMFNTFLKKIESPKKGQSGIGQSKKPNYDTLEICNQYAEIYRKDSIAMRMLAQEMLIHAATCPAAQAAQ